MKFSCGSLGKTIFPVSPFFGLPRGVSELASKKPRSAHYLMGALNRVPVLLRRVLHDLAFFHHEGDALGHGDVGGGIAGNGYDVGEFAFLQRASHQVQNPFSQIRLE